MLLTEMMRYWIVQAAMLCEDIELLDLVWKMLNMEGGADHATP